MPRDTAPPPVLRVVADLRVLCTLDSGAMRRTLVHEVGHVRAITRHDDRSEEEADKWADAYEVAGRERWYRMRQSAAW